MQPKLKLLKILDILRQTDKTHPITAPAICIKLAEMGISAERKSVCRDIRTLQEYGYEIILCHDNKLGYYMKGGEVSAPVQLKSKPVTLDLVKVTLEFKKEDAELVREIMGEGEESEDGEYITAVFGHPSSNLFEDLFTLGETAKLIEPTHIKEEFERKLSDVAEFYRKRRTSGKIDYWLL